MTHALFKQIDLTAKLGQDGSALQAMNALRVIRETVAKHLAGTEGAGEIPLERALLALRTIAEFPCSEQDDLPAANMRQIALAALGDAGASSEPGNPGAEPVSGPGNAGERPHPAPGSGDSKLAESLQTLVRWLDRAEIEDGYVGVPVIEAVEVVVNELRRLQAEVADWQEAAGRSRSDVMAYIAERAKLLEEHDVALAEVGALKAELQSQRERNTELIFKLGSATNGWGRCEKERDAAQARCAELKAELAMANDAAAKGDAARHQCAGMEMEIKELRGTAEHWEAESKALQKLLDAALAKLAELEKQEPVAAVSEETFSANGTSDIITRNLPIGTTLYAAPVAQAQHSVPEGWKLVPLEPTPEMLDARRDSEDGMDGYLVEDTEYYFPDRGAVRDFLACVYRGLLAAAPAPGGER
ncbi:hypothetical protein ACWA3W_31530 [Pseudomonas aeruginosa]|uniref:hypothetical protein n=1 Tax=Pseudomonas aeruginosa TaxID=287 RepID=UPI00280E1C75|nr:hypothetical protein [Pseudomonas aeruginosa]MDQ9140227.1 hypothetical protein [Pseudomonas aeruginosa]